MDLLHEMVVSKYQSNLVVHRPRRLKLWQVCLFETVEATVRNGQLGHHQRFLLHSTGSEPSGRYVDDLSVDHGRVFLVGVPVQSVQVAILTEIIGLKNMVRWILPTLGVVVVNTYLVPKVQKHQQK